MFLNGRGAGRRVESLIEVQGLDAGGDYLLKPLAPSVLDHKLIDRCLAAGDKAGFAARFLEARGLAWAAKLIERWSRRTTPPPIQQTPTRTDPAEGVPAASPCLPGRRAAFAEGSSAGRSIPHRRRAAAWSSQRTALPERLSPFRVVAGKSKRSGS